MSLLYFSDVEKYFDSQEELLTSFNTVHVNMKTSFKPGSFLFHGDLLPKPLTHNSLNFMMVGLNGHRGRLRSTCVHAVSAMHHHMRDHYLQGPPSLP